MTHFSKITFLVLTATRSRRSIKQHTRQASVYTLNMVGFLFLGGTNGVY